MRRHAEGVQPLTHALKKAENGNSDESDEDEDGDAEEVRMVSTPRGPYYMCSDGSYVRVWNNPHMLAQLAAGGGTKLAKGESDEEPRKRTEDDMGVNELAELWGWNFDFGRPGATLELEGLIWTIVEDTEGKRVCAAVRVLNGALKGSKPDDPADAERILEWKEELVEGRAIRSVAEILEGIEAGV